jgi:hypothetical protein
MKKVCSPTAKRVLPSPRRNVDKFFLFNCWEVVQSVGLQTLDLAILVRVQASQPIFNIAAAKILLLF